MSTLNREENFDEENPEEEEDFDEEDSDEEVESFSDYMLWNISDWFDNLLNEGDFNGDLLDDEDLDDEGFDAFEFATPAPPDSRYASISYFKEDEEKLCDDWTEFSDYLLGVYKYDKDGKPAPRPQITSGTYSNGETTGRYFYFLPPDSYESSDRISG